MRSGARPSRRPWLARGLCGRRARCFFDSLARLVGRAFGGARILDAFQFTEAAHVLVEAGADAGDLEVAPLDFGLVFADALLHRGQFIDRSGIADQGFAARLEADESLLGDAVLRYQVAGA